MPTARIRLPLVLLAASVLAALLAARVDFTGRGWLWNYDMPYFDYPIASFFHDALRSGGLPLWNDRLALGFPLYAEGQIGAFYPPNWLFFLLPPLPALQVLRVVHLAFLGLGTGLLAARLSGSRPAALLASVAIVLCGAVVTKLEWHNLIEAFAWVPWILLPLVRRPHPTRLGLVMAGIGWGVMALPSHPNIFVMTGLAIAAVMVTIRPRPDTIGRLVAIGLVAAGVGAVQLLPSAILWSLSVRSTGLTPDDLFFLTAMPFDLLGAAFANVFVRAGSSVEVANSWYPGSSWSPLEVGAYVGLTVIALAAVGARTRRALPFVAGATVFVVLPIIGGFRPAIWAALPVWNGLHAPVKGYLFLDLMLILLAAIGLARVRGRRVDWRPPAAAVGVFVAGYVVVAAIVLLAPAFFERLVRDYWSWPPPGNEALVRGRAVGALSALWPVAFEIGIGVVGLVLLRRGARTRAGSLALVAIAIVPLALLSPPFNRVLPEGEFTYRDSPFVRTLAATGPYRVLIVGGPGFWAGMPDQLATAGIRDIAMFSSLSLRESIALRDRLIQRDGGRSLARAVGIDTLVTVGGACPGTPLAQVPESNAWICRLEGALRPPYWIPLDAVDADAAPSANPIRPAEAELALERVLARAVPAVTIERSDTVGRFEVDAPAAGWVWIDRSWWPFWTTRVDGVEQPVFRALSGQLVPVAAGQHVIDQDLVPRDALLGLAIGVVTLVAALAWAGVSPRVRRRSRPART